MWFTNAIYMFNLICDGKKEVCLIFKIVSIFLIWKWPEELIDICLLIITLISIFSCCGSTFCSFSQQPLRYSPLGHGLLYCKSSGNCVPALFLLWLLDSVLVSTEDCCLGQ